MIKYHSQFLLDKEKGKTDAKVRYRIKWNGNIVSFNIGYRVDILKWSVETQRCRNNTTHGKKRIPANVINKRIQEFQNACIDLFTDYDLRDIIPDKETFKIDFNIKIGRSAEKRNRDKTLFDFFDDFIKETSILYQWTDTTIKKFIREKQHLKDFDCSLKFEDLNENKLVLFQYYLQDTLGHKTLTIDKEFVKIRRFLRWCVRKGITGNTAFEDFRPKLKHVRNKIIFLTQEEQQKIRDYKIPKERKRFETIRDIFIFQCVTGLRYSDAMNLKWSDVKDKHIEVTSIKDTDNLIIELNVYSKSILNKYEKYKYPKNSVFPSIGNKAMNDSLKELMKLIGIDEPIRETHYIGNKRFDIVSPKYALITTHVGRRTFICTALGLGIPPQVVMKWTGHRDYKSMKPYIDIADKIKENAMEKFNNI